MVPIQCKIRQGKDFCDLCRQAKPPIWECQFPINSAVDSETGKLKAGRSHWFDLCADCAAVERELKNGFLVGIHHGPAPEGP